MKVTRAEAGGEPGIRIDSELLAAAHIMPGERIRVLGEGGQAFDTWAVPARRGSAEVVVTGAGPGGLKTGDRVRVVAECVLVDREALQHEPRVVEVDADNRAKPAG